MADLPVADGVDDGLSETPEDFTKIADQLAAGIAKHLTADTVRDLGVGVVTQGIVAIIKVIAALAVPFAEAGAKTLVELEEPVVPVLAAFVAPIVSGIFGSEASEEAFHPRSGRASRAEPASAVVEAFNSSLYGDGATTIEPGDAGAKRLASAAVHATIEGWLNGKLPEILGDFIPIDWLHFKEFTELSHEITHMLGLQRLVRSGFQPLVDVTAVTPMRWYVNKTFTPELLSPAEAIDLQLRGLWTSSQVAEECSRQGFSTERIEAMRILRAKYLPVADAMVLVREGLLPREIAIQSLRDQGWDAAIAELAVSAEEAKRHASIRDDAYVAVKNAFVSRRIGDAELAGLIPEIFPSPADQESHVTALQVMRSLNTKQLSPAEARACVKAGVLAIADYREALRLDGYEEDAVLALELLLETELNANADVEKLRKQKADDAAAAKQAAADAAKKRADDVAAQRELDRRGSLALLQRAVVRGLIPTSRYAEVLTPQYDADTVATMIALVEQDRADYVAQQQRAADAAKRAAVRHIDVGALQAAYLDNVLTLDQVRAQLTALAFDAGDAAILLSTMQARKTDLDAAKQQRADAAAKAKTKSIDLGRFETLVRRGHRTQAEYAALLTSLGYDAGSVAAMVDLLQLQIADDTAARDARAAAAAKATTTGLSLEQIRRAVILGITSTDAFQTYLVKNKYTVDAQTVLVAEVRLDLQEADAARAKRAAAEAVTVETHAPLATVARAARLGIVTPDVYAQRLIDAGYTDDDIAIEMDLLAVEIADLQAARARADAVKAASADHGLSLDQIARAVKIGATSIDVYRARAIELGYSDEDAATLVLVLAADVQSTQDAQARHDAIGGQLKTRNLSLSDLDAAVKAGQMTIDQYNARVLALGYGADDADLLTTLLVLKLSAAPPAGGTP